MKPTNATLNAILAGRQFYTADLITFTLQDGTALRYTNAQVDFGQVGIAQDNSTQGSSVATTSLKIVLPKGPPALGNTLLGVGAFFQVSTALTMSMSDGLTSFTPTPAGPRTSTALQSVIEFFTLNASTTGGSTITLSFSSAVTGGEIYVAEVSGLSTAPVDAEAFAFSTVSTTAITQPSVTATQDNDFFLAYIVQSNFVSTVKSPWLVTQTARNQFLSNNGDGPAYFVQSSAAAQAANFTIGNPGGTWVCAISAFKTNPTYQAGGITGPYFDRKDNKAKVVWNLGVGTDTLVMDVLPGTATVNGHTWFDAVRLGLFDGADFELDRAYSTAYGTVRAGCAPVLFKGRVAEAEADRAIITFSINDYRELLNQQMPRWLYAAACQNALYDASCTLLSSNFKSTGTVAVGSSFSFIVNTTLAQASGYFDQGKITFTSGANNGLSFPVSSWSSSLATITLAAQTPFLSVGGEQFNIFPGCDLSTGAGGCAKFSNLANFRGMPYIPDPGQAL